MKTGIYMIQNKINKKVYVGSAVNIEKRWREHKRSLNNNKHHSILLQRAWDKCGEENFEFIILEPVKDPAHLLAVEQTFLDYYKCYEPEKGYNICKTAGSQLGLKRSEETKKKMSEASRGKTHSEEAKKKIGEVHKGKTVSEEIRKKISEAQKGKTFSEEHKKKIGEANRGRTFSEEHKKKIGEANRGKTHSEEAKKKMSEVHKGKGKGYSFNKASGKYKASIRINGKLKHLGYYETPEEARATYLQALNNG